MGQLKAAANGVFSTTYELYKGAGYSPSEAKQLATAAAKQNYEVSLRAVQAQFPSGIDRIYKAGRTTDALKVPRRSAAKPRAAPKKKAKKRR